MSNDMSDPGKLRKAYYYAPSGGSGTIRVISRRRKRAETFADISDENIIVVNELIELAEKLANANKGTEAAKIVKIVKRLLDNNQKLQQVVSEVLLDIPN